MFYVARFVIDAFVISANFLTINYPKAPVMILRKASIASI